MAPYHDRHKLPSVLVVDDDADTALSLADVLNLHGFPARAAFSGIEAIDMAWADPPDVVLLDLLMPKMSGWQLASALKRLARPPVVVAISGVGGAATDARCGEAGISLHLVKPVSPQFLVDLLRELGCATASRLEAVPV